MQADTLASLFEISHRVLHMNLEGISHDESLLSPDPGGNCVNWVLGHIVATRNLVHDLIGAEPVWTEDIAAPYRRGSEPITSDTDTQNIETITAALDQSQGMVLHALATVTEADLAAPFKEETAGKRLMFLHFHEAYHTGQIGILRRMAGKPGAIP